MNPSLKQAKLALNFEGYIGNFQMIFWNAEMVKILRCLEKYKIPVKDKKMELLILFFTLFRGVHNADKG